MLSCPSSGHSTPMLHRELTLCNGARSGKQIETTTDRERYLVTQGHSFTLCSPNRRSRHQRAIRYSSPLQMETSLNTRLL